MQIYGFQKTTLLDYPGHVAATIFTGGCNFRCPFCQNGDLVLHAPSLPCIPEDEVLQVLRKRKGILTGVCITGGEPALQPDLPDFLARLKSMGYLVKLDSNGYRPDVLRLLYERGLLDYVAMDIKSSPQNYAAAAGLQEIDMERIRESVRFLTECALPCEFRTTVVRELHCAEDFHRIGSWLRGCDAFFLQSYRESEGVISPVFSACTREELEEYLRILRLYIPNAALRGVD